MHLHYLEKVKIRVFVKILMLEKRIWRNLTYWKNATFWLWHQFMANITRKTCTKFYQILPRFVKDMTKHFGIFRFTVLTAVQLQNAKAKFHKVGHRHYSGEAENVYISVRRTICTKFYHNRSGCLDCISKKNISVCFSVHSVEMWNHRSIKHQQILWITISYEYNDKNYGENNCTNNVTGRHRGPKRKLRAGYRATSLQRTG